MLDGAGPTPPAGCCVPGVLDRPLWWVRLGSAGPSRPGVDPSSELSPLPSAADRREHPPAPQAVGRLRATVLSRTDRFTCDASWWDALSHVKKQRVISLVRERVSSDDLGECLRWEERQADEDHLRPAIRRARPVRTTCADSWL